MADSMLKLALLVSISGLVLLAYLAYFIGTTHIELSNLASYNGRTVIVRGKVTATPHYSEVTFLCLGEDTVKVVLFGLHSQSLLKET